MEQPILNTHNKDEHRPSHTVGLKAPLKYGGNLCFAVVMTTLIFAGCVSKNKIMKNDGFCPTFMYEGRIIDKDSTASNFSISLMTLLDSSIVGSYYHDSLKHITYNIGGKANLDKTFEIGEFRNGSLAFVWKGTKTNGGKTIEGIRTDVVSGDEFWFEASIAFGKSYWDYIRLNASYGSYTDMGKALLHKKDVRRISFERQGLTSLPNELLKLENLESVNLLGNNLDSFPPILAQMKNVFYLSLCSNNMDYIGPEIGEMTNLRILIINKNRLRSIPKEIGKLTNLMYLEVGENPIDSLPEEIKNLTRLQELHIDNWESSSKRFSDEYKKHLQKLLPNCKIYFDKNE